MTRLLAGAFSALLLTVGRLEGQGMHDLRAAAHAPRAVAVNQRPAGDSLRPAVSLSREAERTADSGVSRRSLAIGAGVGALVGGVVAGLAVNNTDFARNEAAPMFIGIGAGIGALIGAGIGMAVVAWVLP